MQSLSQPSMGSAKQVVVSALAAALGAYFAAITLLIAGAKLLPPPSGSGGRTLLTQPSWIASVHSRAQTIRPSSGTQSDQQPPNAALPQEQSAKLDSRAQPTEPSSMQRDQQPTDAAVPPTRMIITGRFEEDVSWLPLKLGGIPVTVYQFVDNITDHEVRCPPGVPNSMRHADCPANVAKLGGRESIVYLDYIVNNYYRLPDKMLFIHPHEIAWHRDNIVNLFHRLRWDAVEFANIRHWRFVNWACGNGYYPPCGCVLTLMLTPLDTEASRSPLLNDGDTARNWAVYQSGRLWDFWERLFQDEFGDIPARIMEPACCAEFLVSRERVQLRPLSFYENALKVVNEATDADDGHTVGVAMEGMWHVLFGEPFISQAVYKCGLVECSDEEAADPLLVPPPILDPFVLHHLSENATAVVKEVDDGTSTMH